MPAPVVENPQYTDEAIPPKPAENPRPENKPAPQPESIDNSAENGIIKETSDKKPITEITDSAIGRIPLVGISGYTDEQCAIIQEQLIS